MWKFKKRWCVIQESIFVGGSMQGLTQRLTNTINTWIGAFLDRHTVQYVFEMSLVGSALPVQQ